MTVTYPDSSWFTEFLGVGDDSFGTLMVQGAATVTSSEVHIGGFANGNGDATVDNFGTWTVSGPFDVAWEGFGTLTVSNGGRVDVLDDSLARIGAHPGSEGHMVVTSGEEWVVDGLVQVGGEGMGTLMISDGGSVDVPGKNPDTGGVGIIGTLLGSSGELTVTDQGSQWTSRSQMQVGREGSGTMTISDGGFMRTGTATSPTGSSGIIGIRKGGSGDATVTGAGDQQTQMILEDQMSLTTVVDVPTAGRGDVRILGCVNNNPVGGCTPPVFGDGSTANVGGDGMGGDPATVDIGGSLIIEGGVRISVGPSLVFTLAGDFINRADPLWCIDDDPPCDPWDPRFFQFDWTSGTLILNGTDQAFEVAGEDVGPTRDGFVDNFAMGQIEVASGSDVTFAFLFHYQPLKDDCSAALYVQDLILRKGSSVTISQCKVYYDTLIDEGAAVTLLGCGELIQLPPP